MARAADQAAAAARAVLAMAWRRPNCVPRLARTALADRRKRDAAPRRECRSLHRPRRAALVRADRVRAVERLGQAQFQALSLRAATAQHNGHRRKDRIAGRSTALAAARAIESCSTGSTALGLAVLGSAALSATWHPANPATRPGAGLVQGPAPRPMEWRWEAAAARRHRRAADYRRVPRPGSDNPCRRSPVRQSMKCARAAAYLLPRPN